MFKEFYEPNLSVAQEGRNGAIEALKKGTQDEKLPLTVRLVRANALIGLLKEKLALDPTSVPLKIDVAEAETYKNELESDLTNQSGELESSKAA
jgi:hypothetical protein